MEEEQQQEVASMAWLNKIAKEKTTLLDDFFAMEPCHVEIKDKKTGKMKSRTQGEDMVQLWDKIYDPIVQSIRVETALGPSTPLLDYVDSPNANPVMPYQQLRSLVGDGGMWKWPDIWKSLDLLPRRGKAYRCANDPIHLKGQIQNPNPDIVPLNCLVVGGGPVGLRLAIELVLGGHRVTVWEKRREIRDPETGELVELGFTNRVNRPHINNFTRNDLDRLNGRRFMSPKMCYPVFTNTHTSSIGIDELQMLLLKTALLVGVNFELGVGYETAVVEVSNDAHQRPRWLVSYTADNIAVDRYGLEATGQEGFDALFGCDGGNSRVRKTQVEWLGEPQTRVYKKMFGIVSNLRKCSRVDLTAMGFTNGLEPEDLAGQQTGIYFYKASYHNYLIVHPSKAEMAANGIPWTSIYTFDKGRQKNTEHESDEDQLKRKLKKYITKKAKALKIPIDESAENDGFVDAPNDVMGFDFSQFYNCEKSAACYVPPLDWDKTKDGEWEIFCPLVALAGDAVTDPNWLLGVGLQRGWNSALDCAFYADSLYNNKSFNGRPPSNEEPITSPVEWTEHLNNLMNLMQTVGHAAREGHLSSEMDTGTLDERGPVVIQIKRRLQDRQFEPAYVPNVEPWERYKSFELEVARNYKGRLLTENIHPLAARELAIFFENERYVERSSLIRNSATRPKRAMLTWSKRFECSAFWTMMRMLEIDGKKLPGAKLSEKDTSPKGNAQETNSVAAAPDGDLSSAVSAASSSLYLAPNADEIRTMAQVKSDRLRETILNVAMKGPGEHHRSWAEESLGNLIFKKKGSLPSKKTERQEIWQQKELASDRDSVSLRQAVVAKDTVSSVQPQNTALSTSDPCARIVADMTIRKFGLEKKALHAKLAHAQAEVTKVAYEQKALEAKMRHAVIEVETIQQCLEAYEEAEAKLGGTFSNSD